MLHFYSTVRNQLQAKYPDVAGRIIAMALESVDYTEEKAVKILEIVMQDDKTVTTEPTQEVKAAPSVENNAVIPKSERYHTIFESLSISDFCADSLQQALFLSVRIRSVTHAPLLTIQFLFHLNCFLAHIWRKKKTKQKQILFTIQHCINHRTSSRWNKKHSSTGRW